MLDNQSVKTKYLTFSVQNQAYCLGIENVIEIKGYTQTTKFPLSLEYMLGVINIRGTILPIFDLKSRFGFGKSDLNTKKVMILLSYHKYSFGLLVDSVDGIIECTENELKNSSTARSALSEDFIESTILLDDKIFILLNLSNIIHEEVFESISKHAKEN